MLNVLFLCTHNSARSILSEALLNHLDRRSPARRFQAWSAGMYIYAYHAVKSGDVPLFAELTK